ncbi:MAG: thioredoxin family protein [Flavobacteriaceae bacterium]|nr:thioredoxin family protein [Flavobacteriaceae bacterium]
MKRKLLVVLILISFTTQAQHTIKGEMHPVENYPWILLYKLQGAKQDFIAYDSIKEGAFEITIPKNASSGIYRLIYDNQSQLFVDVIYDNEDIEFNFHPKHPNSLVQFSKSKNNKLYFDYLRAIAEPQRALDSLQIDYFKPNANGAIGILYQKRYDRIQTVQNHFEEQSQGTLAYHFIKSSARYNPSSPLKKPEDYLKETQEHFFDHIDFNSAELDNSTFKHDKINDFIFYLNRADDSETQARLRKDAIDHVLEKVKTNRTLSQEVLESLLINFAKREDVAMTNFVLNHYLRLPKELQDAGFINDVKGQLRTALGNIAPNILWEENGQQKTLHKLSGYSNYLVIFWSSGCSHCLKELPLLKDYLKDKPHIDVIAVGLEDEQSTVNWEKVITNYPKWTHIYGKDKWKNKFANAYGVSSTPSLYLLDPQKLILSKPDDVKELKAFFNRK